MREFACLESTLELEEDDGEGLDGTWKEWKIDIGRSGSVVDDE